MMMTMEVSVKLTMTVERDSSTVEKRGGGCNEWKREGKGREGERFG